jgi:multicomponent Na+:H+ antiporter subunit D
MSAQAIQLGAHLPVLQVVVPLLSAPICALMYRPRIAWAMALAVSAMALVMAIVLLDRVLETGPISYALGGWAAPWGIEYRIDTVNAFVLVIVSAISTIVLPFARDSVEQEVREDRVSLFYTAWMLCLTGLLGIAITGDAFNVFVFLEISSLSSYVLISLGSERRALMASLRYLVMGTIGATFIVLGVGLLYVMTGTLNMVDLAERLAAVEDTRTVKVAFVFLTVGIGIKMALFPLHAWLPNAYAYAPSAVSAFLAGSATKVAVYVWLRFFFTIFGADFALDSMSMDLVLLPLALVAIVVASTIAVFQNDAKRLLAYSSIAQIGYMALGISLFSVTGLTAAIVHLFNHAIIKTALFMALGCIIFRTGSASIASLAGIGRRMPWTMAAFVFGAMSLIGVPLTVGFISKWYLLLAALEQGWWPIAVAVVLTSLLAAVYCGRVIEVAYFRDPKPGSIQSHAREAPLLMLVPVWILIAANIYFGIDTDLTVDIASRAAAVLLGAEP